MYYGYIQLFLQYYSYPGAARKPSSITFADMGLEKDTAIDPEPFLRHLVFQFCLFLLVCSVWMDSAGLLVQSNHQEGPVMLD